MCSYTLLDFPRTSLIELFLWRTEIYEILSSVTKRVYKDQAVLLFLEGWGCLASVALEVCLVCDVSDGAAGQDF